VLAKEQKLEALLKKDQDRWTKKERNLFKGLDGLREDTLAAMTRVTNACGQLVALYQQKTAYVQLLVKSHTRKMQLQDQLDELPAISLEDQIESFRL
jgi:hypothetical protein